MELAATDVLVAYATGHGSTAGVAERLATGLREHGHDVDLRPVRQVPAVDATAVVLGSPVYNGAWLPDAARFAQDNGRALAARPVWLFSVAAFGDDKRLLGPLMRKEPQNIGELRRTLRPRGYRVFAGAIEEETWSWPGRVLFRACGGRFGDNRDWRRIDAWAGEVARGLAAGPPSRP